MKLSVDSLTVTDTSALLLGEWPLVLLLVCIVVLACVVVYACRDYRRRARKEYLYLHSEALRGLLDLNEVYRARFCVYRSSNSYEEGCPSKARFDAFDSDAYLCRVLREEREGYIQLLKYMNSNRREFDAYKVDCRRIYHAAPIPDVLPRCFKSFQDYRDYERAEFNYRALKPELNLKVKVIWSYTSPQGRNSYYDKAIYCTDEIIEAMKDIQERLDFESSTAYQRRLMTPGLRIEILKRDGYRCRICGRSAQDGVKLEVDHIVPVSKGGKTVASNLQTLCWDCNRGKSNRDM